MSGPSAAARYAALTSSLVTSRPSSTTRSVTDLVVQVAQEASIAQVNEAFQAAAEGPLKGYLHYTADPIVSSDIVGTPWSCTFDSLLTMAHGDQVKIIGWYDNEWGYSNRLADLAVLVGASLPARS